MARQMLLLMVFVEFGMLACTDDHQKLRSRPSQEGEENNAYLDHIESEVIVSTETISNLGENRLYFPVGTYPVDYRVRMSRITSAPVLTESASLVLGDPESDILEIVLSESDAGSIANNDLLKAYELRQLLRTPEIDEKIGLMIISNHGKSDEQRSLIPSSQIDITPIDHLGLTGTKSRARIQLTASNAIMWLVRYTEVPAGADVGQGSDTVAPTVGKLQNATNITTTGFRLNWTAGSDNQTASQQLQYYVCSAPELTSIQTIDGCLSANRQIDWTPNFLSAEVTGSFQAPPIILI